MSESKAPAYKFRVAHPNGRLNVEAAYSEIEPTGHMVLKDAAGHPVFTAEPGLQCTFERRERVSPAAAPDGRPAPVGFAAFEEAWAKACYAAWDDGRRHPAVLLPDFIWPGVASMVNPVTGEEAKVTRVRTFPVQNWAEGGPGEPPADHWAAETVERVRVTHTATGKSAEAPTRDEATGKLVRRLVEDGDISVNAARRVHGLGPLNIPEASQPGAGLLMKARDAGGCCGESACCSDCA